MPLTAKERTDIRVPKINKEVEISERKEVVKPIKKTKRQELLEYLKKYDLD